MTPCGILFENERGEISSCILSPHPDFSHCDGTECYDEIDWDEVTDTLMEIGMIDHHRMPVIAEELLL